MGSVPDLTYCEVLYNFRLEILLEGVFHRSTRDPTRGDDEMARDRAVYNLGRAAELIDTG